MYENAPYNLQVKIFKVHFIVYFLTSIQVKEFKEYFYFLNTSRHDVYSSIHGKISWDPIKERAMATEKNDFFVFVLFVFLVPVEGLKSQKYFDELRHTYINELNRLVNHRITASSQRFFHLTRLMDSLHIVSEIRYFPMCSLPFSKQKEQ